MQRIRIILMCGALASIASAGCGENPAKSALLAQSTDPPEVTIAHPIEKPIIDFEEFTGRTEAVESVDIRARVTGFIESRKFEEGDEVAVNAPLFVIDHRPYDADLAAAKATLARDVALQGQRASDFERVKQLREKGQVSLEEYDRSLAQKQEADADVDKTRADIDKAALNVEFCFVKAPIAGRISRAQLTEGNLVNADTTLLTTIVSVDRMYVYFDVDERAVLKFQQMLRETGRGGYREEEVPVYMALALDTDFPFRGAINFVENKLDPNTGTIRVRAVFDNPAPKSGPRLLTPGLFARVRLPVSDEHPAILIPERAIGTDQGQKFVYVVDKDDRAEYRRIVVGAVHDGMRVIREGVGLEDRVIVNGLQRVRPRAPVKPIEATAAEAGADQSPADGKKSE
jgi:RND family efflux transporter MFP subunit